MFFTMRALRLPFLIFVSYCVAVVSPAHIPTNMESFFAQQGNSSLSNAVNVTG